MEGWENKPDLDKENIFKEMKRKGFQPDTVDYGIFMNVSVREAGWVMPLIFLERCRVSDAILALTLIIF